MERCKNCGRKTLATLDWACPWCGYPLKTGNRLEKTYSELLGERRAIRALERDNTEREPYIFAGTGIDLPDNQAPPAEASEAGEILMTEDEEMFLNQAIGRDGENPGETCCEQEQVIPLPEPCTTVDEPAAGLQAPAQQPGEVQETVEEAPIMETEPEPVVAIDITVEELLEAYQLNDSAADAKYNNHVLALSGMVAMISFRENRDFQYINLTGKDQNLFRSIKCMFSPGDAFQLRSLEWGQPVVIRGRFKGSLTAMSLVDCCVIQ